MEKSCPRKMVTLPAGSLASVYMRKELTFFPESRAAWLSFDHQETGKIALVHWFLNPPRFKIEGVTK